MKLSKKSWCVLGSMALAMSAALIPERAAADLPPVPSELELSVDEIRKLLADIENTGMIGPESITLDSLRDPQDATAYRALDIAVSQATHSSLKSLAEMKKAVVTYSVLITQSGVRDSTERYRLLTKSYSAFATAKYHNAISAWLPNDALYKRVLGKCVSDVCLIEIATAFEAMNRFAQSIDRDLDFSKINEETRLFFKFNQPLLDASFSRTFRSIVRDNENHSMIRVLAAGLFTPLSVVGVTSLQLIRKALSLNYVRIGLSVKRSKVRYGHVFKVGNQQYENAQSALLKHRDAGGTGPVMPFYVGDRVRLNQDLVDNEPLTGVITIISSDQRAIGIKLDKPIGRSVYSEPIWTAFRTPEELALIE